MTRKPITPSRTAWPWPPTMPIDVPGQHARIAPAQPAAARAALAGAGAVARRRSRDRRRSGPRAALRGVSSGRRRTTAASTTTPIPAKTIERRRQAERREDEQRRDRRADDRAEPEGGGERGERVGPLLALGARGDIGLDRGRRGRAQGAVERRGRA